ncbi:hypothetical protein QWY91_00380 [Zunongwangia endophytica]|nr:hypothetical protein [Zunongwangia endophytica]MDN3593332.1 hypothetical protein [Zunongwangia endophytica]
MNEEAKSNLVSNTVGSLS